MFARAQRLRRSNDIITTLRTGSRARFAWGELTYLPKHGSRKVAVIISKKVAPHAVDRNRMKRRVRPLLAQYLPDGGWWILRFTTPLPDSVDVSALSSSLQSCLSHVQSRSSRER
jgi:RNase P protein component